MSKATSQAFSSYRWNRTVLSFRERYRLTVFVSNGTVAVMAQRGVSLKSVLTCYEKNKMIFFFIWAVIDFLTINISWFLLNIKQHPSPISRKPQTVLNVRMAWIVCIVLFSYHKCACPMSRAIAATFWPRGRRALRARRPRGPNVKKINSLTFSDFKNLCLYHKLLSDIRKSHDFFNMLIRCYRLNARSCFFVFVFFSLFYSFLLGVGGWGVVCVCVGVCVGCVCGVCARGGGYSLYFG